IEGKNIPVVIKSKKFDEKEVQEGIKHGIVYGDGSLDGYGSRVLLFGNKIELVRFFRGENITPHYRGDYVGVYNMPEHYKNLPNPINSESYWQGFITGLIATDGYVDERGSFGFHSSNLKDLEIITDNLHKTNFFHSSLKKVRRDSPFDGSYAPLYKVQLVKKSADETSFIRTNHLNNYENSNQDANRAPSVKVIKVTPLNISEAVY